MKKIAVLGFGTVGSGVVETIDINGLFDTKTENAVREFQRINGLDITGEVDKLTWNRLAASYQKYAFSEG